VNGDLSHYLIILGACFLFSERAYAGAWNQRAGEGQVISTSYWSNAGQIFNEDYEAVPLQGFTKTETRFYIEQGFTDWLTFVGNTGIQTLNFRDNDSRFDFDGLDDVELGLQFKTHAREGLSTAIRLSYVIDSRLDNQAVDVLRGGDQYELRALIGQRSQSYLNFSNNDKDDGFEVPEQTQLTSQLSLARQYKPGRYIQLGGGQTLFGQNIVKERSLFIGIWTEY